MKGEIEMAERELTPLEQHELTMREEFVAAHERVLTDEDAELLEHLRSRAAEAEERENRARELAVASAEEGLDLTRVETDRINNLGATRFTSDGSDAPVEHEDNLQTKGGGGGATSASTATPSAGTRSTSVAADPSDSDVVADNLSSTSIQSESAKQSE